MHTEIQIDAYQIILSCKKQAQAVLVGKCAGDGELCGCVVLMSLLKEEGAAFSQAGTRQVVGDSETASRYKRNLSANEQSQEKKPSNAAYLLIYDCPTKLRIVAVAVMVRVGHTHRKSVSPCVDVNLYTMLAKKLGTHFVSSRGAMIRMEVPFFRGEIYPLVAYLQAGITFQMQAS
jgi:hypothetical protein